MLLQIIFSSFTGCWCSSVFLTENIFKTNAEPNPYNSCKLDHFVTVNTVPIALKGSSLQKVSKLTEKVALGPRLTSRPTKTYS